MNTMQYAAPTEVTMAVAPPRRLSTMRSPTLRASPSPTSTDIAIPTPEVASPGRILTDRFVDGSPTEIQGGRDPQRSGTQDSDQTAVDPERTIDSIQAFSPHDTRRYDPRRTESLVHLAHGPIRSSVMMRIMKEEPTMPNGWRKYTHPEGMPYYYNHAKEVPIATENDLSDPTMLDLIEEGYEAVMHELETSKISITGILNKELCLYIYPHRPNVVYYYFVDHDAQYIFWLDDVDSEDLGLHRFLNEEHLKTLLRAQYFRHIEYFPRSTLPPSAEEELLQIIAWNSIDYLTCPTSTSPYDKSTLDDFASIVKTCPSNVKTLITARLLALFLSHQFFNCHGLPYARLERTTKIEDHPTHPVGWPMTLIFAFLLNSPRAHLKKLNELRVDEVLYKLQWPKFLEGLIRDWSEISVLASIVLASNMGFLAISSDLYSSTISLMSTLLALGCIIVSVVNGRQQRGRMDAGAEEGGLFLERVHHPRFGLQPLAVYLSLPYTMMLWSVISFAGAMIFFCFRPPNGSNDDNPGGGGGGGGGNGPNIPDMTDVTKGIMVAVVAAVGFVVLLTVGFVWLDDRLWVARSREGWTQWWQNRWQNVKTGKRSVAKGVSRRCRSWLPKRGDEKSTGDVESGMDVNSITGSEQP